MRGIKTSLEDFKNTSNIIHNNYYDYSAIIDFKNGKEKVEIKCPKHGSFRQRLSSHLGGYGCKICCNEGQRDSNVQFIQKSKEIHKDKYDYSKVDYFNSSKKVEIICKDHGTFLQMPETHLSGAGCPSCGGVKRVTKEDFVERSKNVHDNKYEYSLVEFSSISQKIKIICPVHKIFEQVAADHMNGHGCRLCTRIISLSETKWLKDKIPDDELHRQVSLKINNKRFIVDGYDPKTKTIYEFLGDFWHGNPEIYKESDLNDVTKKKLLVFYMKKRSKELNCLKI